MRAIKTIVLRLLIDVDDENPPIKPPALRGTLQALADNDPRPFTCERELLALLQQALVNGQAEQETR